MTSQEVYAAPLEPDASPTWGWHWDRYEAEGLRIDTDGSGALWVRERDPRTREMVVRRVYAPGTWRAVRDVTAVRGCRAEPG